MKSLKPAIHRVNRSRASPLQCVSCRQSRGTSADSVCRLRRETSVCSRVLMMFNAKVTGLLSFIPATHNTLGTAAILQYY